MDFFRHRTWPGDGSTVQWKWSPPAPLLPSLLKNVQTRERKGYERGTARNFLQSFPLSGTPVVQSYWAWKRWTFWTFYLTFGATCSGFRGSVRGPADCKNKPQKVSGGWLTMTEKSIETDWKSTKDHPWQPIPPFLRGWRLSQTTCFIVFLQPHPLN